METQGERYAMSRRRYRRRPSHKIELSLPHEGHNNSIPTESASMPRYDIEPRPRRVGVAPKVEIPITNLPSPDTEPQIEKPPLARHSDVFVAAGKV